MIICIDMDARTKQDLDRLLEIGKYGDYSQAIALAISNQLLLHQRMKEQGNSVVLDAEQRNEADSTQSLRQEEKSSAPAAFALSAITATDCEAAPLPTDTFVVGASVPVDRWIFGQHNKLLPAKASCRALAVRSISGRGIALAKAASEIAADAVDLGDYLRSLEQMNGLGRDEALSIAFPYSGSDTADKARLRYANQFVASINKQGQLSGLLVDLKLVNLVRAREPRLSLTFDGWKFARLPNPILDQGGHGSPKLSPDEMDFLINHISSKVPAEDFAYRTVLRALTQGANTPEKLDAFLQQFVSKRAEKPFTSAFLATQRSGVISRMADLNLVERQREGVNVTYVATKRAIQYLNTISQEVRTA